MPIEVDLTTEGLNEDLAALWSLKRLAFLNSVDSNRVLRGLRHGFIIPVTTVFDAAVFLAQWRSSFEIF